MNLIKDASGKTVLKISLADWQSLTTIASMPYGRVAGLVKRYIRSVLIKNNWTDFSIHESRNGSGFEVHGWRDMEQLPDIGPPGGRENRHAQEEFDQEAKIIQAELLNKVKPPSQEVVVNIRIHKSGMGDNKASFYAYLKYDTGGYVTPIEFL